MPLPARIYKKTSVQMPMTALIDIVFLLLIYFLLSINYLASDILPLELASAATASPQRLQAVTVSLDAEGVVHFGGYVISDAELLKRLWDNVTGPEPRPVVIRADERVELARTEGRENGKEPRQPPTLIWTAICRRSCGRSSVTNTTLPGRGSAG